MDDDVAKLVREERIAAAATLAAARGDPTTASELFERACEWRRAAEEAMRAGDPARALPLAVVARDDMAAERALAALTGDAAASSRVARTLEQRGDFAWAARVFESLKKMNEAAHAWERAGEAVRAARLLEEAGDPVGAARVLEAGIRRAPSLAANRVALGRLLLRHGKTEAATRALQSVPLDAPERREALGALVRAMETLGLKEAAEEARRELEALGGPASDAPPEPKDVQGEIRARLYGRYEVVREVASTASARVVECVDRVRGEHVAVKIFAGYDARGSGRDLLARFEREVKVLASLDHPNVVPLRDYLPEGPALVLAWMSGGTLRDMLGAGDLAPARAVEIACAVLSALGEAHRLGVLHRDVKPANVLFDGAGTARLADFGVAHLGDLSITATAGLIGTFAYMSPEQREGKPATVQSDLYAAGVLLLEMLTGERPEGEGPPRVLPSGAHRDLGPRHDAAVLALVALDPAARPSDAFLARRALRALSWPSSVEKVARAPRAEARVAERGGSGRVERREGVDVDTWIDRPIERVQLTEASLARASAFARAGHPALQTVLRVDRMAQEIWLDAPGLAPLGRALTEGEISELRAALDALHGVGGVHGAIGQETVALSSRGSVVLRFVDEVTGATTVDLDRLALARLARGP